MTFVYYGKKYSWSFKKFISNLLIIFVIFLIWFFYVTNIVNATPEKRVIELTVRSGETLWSIAERIAPESDPRITIEKIKANNQLIDSSLKTGQLLKFEI